jgi:hypothetical protein
MPLDNPTTRVEGAPYDRHAALRRLASALRHPKRWPEGFEYHWFAERDCALGLGRALGITTGSAPALGITEGERDRIFFNGWAGGTLRLTSRFFRFSLFPRPNDIAYEIDKVLSRYDRGG